MFHSPWSTFTVFCTIPIAILMGLYMYYIRPGDYKGGSILGVALLALTIVSGPYVASNPATASLLTLSKSQISIFVPIYGFAASVLPVWLLLVPRDYLSSYLKLGTIAALALGIFLVHPNLQMPAATPFIYGGGPVIPGALYPFLFITIACGALSGFHAIIGTGTTPKMISNEKDILFIGYGAMLVEGFVALMALIAACVLLPSDYFAINSAPAAYATLGLTPVHLPELAQAVGEDLVGRTGGAVSLAVGMTYIFSSIPGLNNLTAYWYHFAIMFEAVFILTAVDTGTRVGRYLMQELIGKFRAKPVEECACAAEGKKNNVEIVLTGLIFSSAWGYLLYTGDISTIWPLFGMCNQLLATCALIIGTTMILRMGKAKYAWITAVPAFFMLPVTMSAGYLNIVSNFLPKGLYLLAALSLIVLTLMAIIFIDAFGCWYDILKGRGKSGSEHQVSSA
jgi:carbon starvation protein